MAVEYDPSVIYEFAERLYSRATAIAVLYAAVGLLFGAIGGGAVGFMAGDLGMAVLGALIAGGLGVAVGVAGGIEKGFQLRLQAQQALCQVKIEESVRHTASTRARDAGQ